MSSFSDSILELLLSWVRGIFVDVWNIFSGNSGSFFTWVGKHWLSLICILLIGGITIDLIIYILRWRPQRVWFSRFKRLFGRQNEEDSVFVSGYDVGIESLELDAAPEISEYINSDPQLDQFDAVIDTAPQPEITTEAEAAAVRHRRSDRHVKRNRKRRIRIKIPSLNENETPYATYPAPPVHARDAFHNAVYPSDNAPLWQQNNESNHANE